MLQRRIRPRGRNRFPRERGKGTREDRWWRVVSEGILPRSKKARVPGLAVIELNPGHLLADPWKLSSAGRARR